jgi:hypothetical protein
MYYFLHANYPGKKFNFIMLVTIDKIFQRNIFVLDENFIKL